MGGLSSFLLSLLCIEYLILVDGLLVETWFLVCKAFRGLLPLLRWVVHDEASKRGFGRQRYCSGTTGVDLRLTVEKEK